MPLRAVVFDFDGVIANSEPLHLRAFQDVLREERVTLTEADYYAHYLGFDDAGVFRAVGDASGVAWTAPAIEELVARKAVYLEALERNMSLLFPGAADAIQRLAASVPLAIASGALGREIRRVLEREQLTSAFTAIVPADAGLPPKPAPDPYLHALAELRRIHGDVFTAAECVAVEDSKWGLQSARTAGLRTVAVTHTYPAADLADADRVIASLHELTVDSLAALVAR
jgi:beta-phosphoglucomutase